MKYPAISGRGINEPSNKAKIYALRGWGIEPKIKKNKNVNGSKRNKIRWILS